MSSVGVMASGVHIAAGPAAFPVLASQNAATATMTVAVPLVVPAPTGVTAGDLLLSFAGLDGGGGSDPGMTASTGWTLLATLQHSANTRLSAFARVADGGTNDALRISQPTATNPEASAAIFRITGHTVTALADIKLGQSQATSGNIDPPSLDAGRVGKWLWLAVGEMDSFHASVGITALPAGYTAVYNFGNLVRLGIGQKSLEVQTENPPTFTNYSWYWNAFTVAVPG